MPVSKIVAGQKIAPQKLERAKQLRRDMTPEEKMLWEALRGNKLGSHFRRQQIIAGFIVDFYCHAAALVIEVDGGGHERPDQKRFDAKRDRVLREMGLRTVRFPNRAISTSLPQVVEKIRELTRGRLAGKV